LKSAGKKNLGDDLFLQHRDDLQEFFFFAQASNFRLADGPSEVYDVYTTGFAPTMRWVAGILASYLLQTTIPLLLRQNKIKQNNNQ
jgi:hypothetical protein